MTVNRRFFIALGTSSLMLPNAFAQAMDLSDAINKAGRQRMLLQRMSKAYMCLGQQIQVSAATKVMEQSIALFDRQLGELKAYAPNGAVRETYTRMEAEWVTNKALLLSAPPSEANAAKLLVQDGKVLELAQKATGQLEQLSGKPVAKLVNMAGRQRMLSQRMAKYYLAMAWNVGSATSATQLEQARVEFMTTQEALRNAPETTPEIKQELVLADAQWLFFDAAIRAPASANGKGANNVFMASENLLQVMDKVADLYVRMNKA